MFKHLEGLPLKPKHLDKIKVDLNKALNSVFESEKNSYKAEYLIDLLVLQYQIVLNPYLADHNRKNAFKRARDTSDLNGSKVFFAKMRETLPGILALLNVQGLSLQDFIQCMAEKLFLYDPAMISSEIKESVDRSLCMDGHEYLLLKMILQSTYDVCLIIVVLVNPFFRICKR